MLCLIVLSAMTSDLLNVQINRKSLQATSWYAAKQPLPNVGKLTLVAVLLPVANTKNAKCSVKWPFKEQPGLE